MVDLGRGSEALTGRAGGTVLCLLLGPLGGGAGEGGPALGVSFWGGWEGGQRVRVAVRERGVGGREETPFFHIHDKLIYWRPPSLAASFLIIHPDSFGLPAPAPRRPSHRSNLGEGGRDLRRAARARLGAPVGWLGELAEGTRTFVAFELVRKHVLWFAVGDLRGF